MSSAFACGEVGVGNDAEGSVDWMYSGAEIVEKCGYTASRIASMPFSAWSSNNCKNFESLRPELDDAAGEEGLMSVRNKE